VATLVFLGRTHNLLETFYKSARRLHTVLKVAMYWLLRVTVACLLVSVAVGDPCPNSCSQKGRCHTPGATCKCFDGYTGADCSQLMCPFGLAWADHATGVDVAHVSAECSNMGICDRSSGLCNCRPGFEGTACERTTCPASCTGVGECQSMYYYAQNKDPGEGEVFTYANNWDAHKIYGCRCDSAYDGYSCALRQCPTGDDPMTGNGADVAENPAQKNDQQKVTCKAGSGTFTMTFRGKTTTPIPYNGNAEDIQTALEALPTLGSGHVVVLLAGAQACTESGALATSFTVEFLQTFGNLPLMVPDRSLLANLNPVSGATILSVSKQITGSKENRPCSGRGLCDTTSGFCVCNINYDTSNGYDQPGIRGDCGYATATIQVCPGAIACNAHGVCAGNPTYKCDCDDGWTGSDCSERLCPKDVAWFTLPNADNEAHLFESVECSNMGFCDRASGVCSCNEGFTGAACQQLTCSGGVELCTGHGQCLDMTSLAELATVNGNLAGYTYGRTPNKPETWDGLKIYGCHCDEGYTGFDCSERICPTGDDPRTTEQHDEVHIISCSDSDGAGSISFKFREQVTVVPILPTASRAEVAASLETLSTIGHVSVDLVDINMDDELCTISGNQFAVTYKTEHGNLPILEVIQQNTDSIVVQEEVIGTKETLECAGRGVCDTGLGTCMCFIGYGSSDGMGGPGQVGDCGYLEPIVSVSN
jgi:hypothetical protein